MVVYWGRLEFYAANESNTGTDQRETERILLEGQRADLGSFNKRVLFTSAGFTKNWRGLLATEFWSHLVSSPYLRSQDKIGGLLLEEFNFEHVYGLVQGCEYSAEDRRCLGEAIDYVLKHQESRMRGAMSDDGCRNSFAGLANYLNLLTTWASEPTQYDTSYMFTLNMDLLLERAYCSSKTALNLPAVSTYEGWPGPDGQVYGYILQTVGGLGSEHPADWPPRLAGNYNYIKLHGSLGWGLSENSDATHRLVIGDDKERVIQRHAVLAWYSEVFKAVCNAGDVRLFVSGYSFNDVHINRSIAEGAETAGLRVWIHTPESAQSMHERLLKMGTDGASIWNGLIGYSSSPLFEIFETLEFLTGEGDRIRRELSL